MLGAAVSRLQWNSAIRQGGSHLHNHAAIARQHPTQCGEGAVDKTQVGDFRDPSEFLGQHFFDRRKDGNHRVVDPDVNGTEALFNCFSCRFDLLGLCDIHRYDESLTAGLFDVAPRALESVAPPREQADAGAALRERARRCAPDAG